MSRPTKSIIYDSPPRAQARATGSELCRAWARVQGWQHWPKDRRYDAILLNRWARRGYPLEAWLATFRRAPAGARVTWLTQPGLFGLTPLEEVWLRHQERRYGAHKAAELAEAWRTRQGRLVRL
jgi:hypothetical protein